MFDGGRVEVGPPEVVEVDLVLLEGLGVVGEPTFILMNPIPTIRVLPRLLEIEYSTYSLLLELLNDFELTNQPRAWSLVRKHLISNPVRVKPTDRIHIPVLLPVLPFAGLSEAKRAEKNAFVSYLDFLESGDRDGRPGGPAGEVLGLV